MPDVGVTTRRRAWVALIAAGLVMTAALILVVVRPGGDDGSGAEEGLSPVCESLHAGHNVMSWNPTMADEMTDAGCDWPYEPFLVSTDGGQEEAALDAAPFGARQYAELWSLLARIDVGVCSVGTLTEPDDELLVFGFRYALAEPGCPDATSLLDLVAREYGTRAHRDAAAMEMSGGAVYVMGRWVLTVDEAPAEMSSAIGRELLALGAVAVPS